MPIFILSLLVQVAFVVHIVRSGRNTMWIWIVVMLPLAGSIAYLFIEILPELLTTRTGLKVRRNIRGIVNPNRDINNAAHRFSITDTVENSMKLADEMMAKGMFEEAATLYRKCLRGVHEHDPDIMYGLAKAEFGMDNFSETRQVLDDLIEKNPNYKNADAHLLYAKALDKLGETEKALEEYAALENYYPGPEPAYLYAMLLRQNGEPDKARALLESILTKSKISGRHYNSLHKQWVKLAKAELGSF